MTAFTASRPFLTDEQREQRRAARRAFMEGVVTRGLAALNTDMTAHDIADMVCISRRTWQRIMAGVEVPPRSVMKLFCLETGLAWETVDPAYNGPYRAERGE